MGIRYRNATLRDLEFLVESRLVFIEVGVGDAAYAAIEHNTRQFFVEHLEQQQCDIVLAEDETGVVVGTGIVFYYSSVPSRFNPDGRNAYITSMYVNESYRRQGIGYTILNMLIQTAKARDYHIFILQESEMGRPLYEKYGFTKGKPGMILRV